MGKLINTKTSFVYFFFILLGLKGNSCHENEPNNAPGLPIGNFKSSYFFTNNLFYLLNVAIIYDKNTSTETINLIDKAIWNINNAIVYGRNRWSVQIKIIEVFLFQKFEVFFQD